MPTAENGWSTVRLSQTTTFLAPNGKIVYARNPDVATILGYVAWRWHLEIEPIAAATYLEGDSETNHRGGVRDGMVAIHSWRPAAQIAGSRFYSVHGAAMAMDVNGHLHPYEYGMRGWRSGFTSAQLRALRAIAAGCSGVLRLGMDFAVGRRDGMHVEIVGTAVQVARAATRIRDAGWLIPTRRGEIVSYQRAVGADADDFHGPGTTRAVKAAQKRLGVPQTGRWDVRTRTAWVQTELKKRGYDLGSGGVDGIPGPIFDRIVRDFQASAGLEVDGIPGKNTVDHLRVAPVSGKPPAKPKPPPLLDPPTGKPDLWLPGAPRLDCSSQAVPVRLQGSGRYHTWHSFEGAGVYQLAAMDGARYLKRTNKLATFVLNPVLGGIVQLLPANVGARTLVAAPPRQHTNAYGDIHMQTEVLAQAARPFTLDLTREGLEDLTRLINFLRAWGIPDQWAWRVQAPPAYPGGSVRRRAPEQSGHAYHSGWWVNDHEDPGAIAPPWTLVGGAAPVAPTYPVGWIKTFQVSLNALGYTDSKGRALDEDDVFGPATEHATKQYQKDAGGLTVDGKPGNNTYNSLEEDMTKLDDIAAAVDAIPSRVLHYRLPPPGGKEATTYTSTFLRYAARRDQVDGLTAQVAALTEAVKALAGGAGADPAVVVAAAEKGAAQALARVALIVGDEEN